MKAILISKPEYPIYYLIVGWLLFVLPLASQAQSLALNEIMASNSTSIADEDGDFEDWIELYNYSVEPVNLAGYGLSDDYNDPFLWVFPDVTIQPGEFMLVWASGKNRTNPGSPLHTNFSINAGGEEVLFTHPSGATIDEILPSAIPTDISYGRSPDGSGTWFFFDQPTPGESNTTNAYSEILEPPVFSHPAGFYSNTFELSITHPEPDATVIYTLDGSIPCLENIEGTTFLYKNQYPENPGDSFGDFLTSSINSLLYSGPIEIADSSTQADSITHISTTWHQEPYYFPYNPVSKGTIIRAMAMKEGMLSSPVRTQSYFVSDEGRDRYSLPVLSFGFCKTDLFDYEQGVYVAGVDYDNWRTGNPDASHNWQTEANFHRSGAAWEKTAHLEYFESDKTVSSLSLETGIRLHGAEARRRPMKSMRLYARDTYGESHFQHIFFPAVNDSIFKRLLLRNSGQDFLYTLFRDAAVQRMVMDLNVGAQEYQPVIVFFNGEYWGIHNLRERTDKYFFQRVYGVDPDNIDYLTNNIEVNEGDANHYIATRNYIEVNGLTEAEHYQYIQTRIDVKNFMDYQISNIFANNHDWPGNNLDYWRLRTEDFDPDAPYGHDGRWRWLLYDMDFCFGMWNDTTAVMNNTLAFATEPGGTGWPNPDWSTFLLRKFLENEEFRSGFINRFADLLNTFFLPDRTIGIINDMKGAIGSEMTEHILRWRTPYSINHWLSHISVMIDFASLRPDFQRQHIIEQFDIEGSVSIILDVSSHANCRIRINTIEITEDTPGVSSNPYPWPGIYFKGIPIELEAIPATGYAFSHWEGVPEGSQATITITPEEDINITAVFERVNEPELIFFWLFDTNLPNNTPLEEVGATFQLPGDGVIQFHSALDGYPFDPDHPNWRKASMERRNEPTEINYRPEGNNGILYPDADMRGLQIKQPFTGDAGENELLFALPSTGFKELLFSFAAKDEGAAEYLVIEYSIIPDEPEWISIGLSSDTLFLAEDYQLFEVNFNDIETVEDNPDFMIRIRFGGPDMAADEGDRVTFNNFSLDGRSLAGFNLPPVVENPVDFHELIESGEDLQIGLNSVFYDPDGDTLVFSAYTDNPEMIELIIEDSILTISATSRGGTNITILADDGYNPPVTNTFWVLIYPEAHRFGDENFTFTEWDANEPEHSYPEHMLFVQSDVNDPGLTEPLMFPYYIPHNDYHADDQGTIGFPYNNTGRTRINGLYEDGISFINTGRGRDLGGALLAIDTRGVTSANLSWLAGTILENSRVYGLRLQYRTSISEDFTDLLTNGEPLEYLAATDGDIAEFESMALPSEILEKEYVQLLWRYYYVSGDSGPRAQLRLDDIIFSDVIGIPVSDENPFNIFSHGNSIFIEMPGNIESVLHVYDLAGRLVQNQCLSGHNRHEIQLSSRKGIYIVRLITDEQVYSRKVLVY
jgi:hypothetical protein